jgi:protein TonB
VREPVEARPDSPRETTEPPKASDHPAAASSGPKAVEPAPPAPPAPKITLSGTDSPSDARSWGDHVIPATPDAVFHNRPPEYPPEAVLNGEHGTVVILIHVSPAGTTAGVDVLRSSGYVLLDRAAREAVLRWRFLPAVKGGEPVGSDVTMGFIFDNN